MSLPAEFSPTEHLQDTIKRIYNGEVREWFADVTSADLDINTPRSSLRTACMHAEADTMDMTLGRQLLFDMVVKQRFMSASGSGRARDLSYNVLRRAKPKITLHFIEDLEAVDAGYSQVEGSIGFRLMNQTTTTLSLAEATTYGNKIKTLFCSSRGFVWRKGKEMCSYTDWEKGYQLQLLCRTKEEGKRVVEQVLDVQGHTPEWENFNYSQNERPSEAFPTVPPSQSILGKTRKLPRRRPVGDVRFQYAFLDIAGLPTPICICDRSGRFTEALVKTYR